MSYSTEIIKSVACYGLCISFTILPNQVLEGRVVPSAGSLGWMICPPALSQTDGYVCRAEGCSDINASGSSCSGNFFMNIRCFYFFLEVFYLWMCCLSYYSSVCFSHMFVWGEQRTQVRAYCDLGIENQIQ